MKKLELNATIMVTIEMKSDARPSINFLGNDSKKSPSAYREVRMDRNMRTEVEENIKETASEMTKTLRAAFWLNKGIPVS